MKSQHQSLEEAKKEALQDLVSQFAGMLSALLPVLAIVGVNFEWFTHDFIESLALLISISIAFFVNVWTIYKNHFSRKKSQLQNAELKQKGLK